MSGSKRQQRQAAQRRIEQRQRQQAQRQQIEQAPDELERERLLARQQREHFGCVRVGKTRPFYLRHLGLDDHLPGPLSDRRDPMPDIIRRRA